MNIRCLHINSICNDFCSKTCNRTRGIFQLPFNLLPERFFYFKFESLLLNFSDNFFCFFSCSSKIFVDTVFKLHVTHQQYSWFQACKIYYFIQRFFVIGINHTDIQKTSVRRQRKDLILLYKVFGQYFYNTLGNI